MFLPLVLFSPRSSRPRQIVAHGLAVAGIEIGLCERAAPAGWRDAALRVSAVRCGASRVNQNLFAFDLDLVIAIEDCDKMPARGISATHDPIAVGPICLRKAELRHG